MKQVIFLVTYYGIDGVEPKSIPFASPDENERDQWIQDQEGYASLFRTEDIVADLADVALETWHKLNGLEKLALAMPSCPIWSGSSERSDISKHCC